MHVAPKNCHIKRMLCKVINSHNLQILGLEVGNMAGDGFLKTRYPVNLIQFSDGSRSYDHPEWATFSKNDSGEEFPALVCYII